MSKLEKHQFALFVHPLENPIIGKEVSFEDKDLIHRITHVLRLSVSDELLFFDKQYQYTVQIINIKKQRLVVTVLSKKQNMPLTPYVKLLLPVLKKDALAQAVYNAVESGASEIQLIYTEKAQRIISAHDLDRLERVAIAAAEQSKYFSFPSIQAPILFDQAIVLSREKGIFFDPAGLMIQELLQSIDTQIHINLLIGPEGDLTQKEKDHLRQNQWSFCSLTPTILRAAQAVTVGLGLYRSLFR